MKSKRTSLILGLLILSVATLQQSFAQVPCIPTVIPSPTLSVDWPQFLHDAAHSNCNSYESILSVNTVGNLTMKWRYHFGDGDLRGDSAPVLANGVLYFGSTTDLDGFLSAVNADTGDLLWTHEFPGYTLTSSPTVANGTIYIGAGPRIYALNTAGEVVWSTFPAWPFLASPVVANGIVYASSSNGNVYAFSTTTGSPIWTSQISQTNLIQYSSPAVVAGVVYVGSNDNNVYALDAKTGALIWKYTTGSTVNASPSVSNGVVYISSLDRNVYALNAKTGALLWKYRVDWYISTAAAEVRGVVYVWTDQSHLYALSASSGVLLWTFTAPDGNQSSPSLANGVLYLTGNQDIYALDASTGVMLWKSATDYPPSSPVIANGVLYVESTCCMTAYHLPGGVNQ